VVRAALEKDVEISVKAYDLMSSLSEYRTKTLFEYNGLPGALLHGLNTNHQGIVSNCTHILCNIMEDDDVVVEDGGYPDDDILPAHSDLVTAVVNTFCEGKVPQGFSCKLINYYFPLLVLC
jgi:hypothetical protein